MSDPRESLYFQKLLIFGDSITEFSYNQFPMGSGESAQFSFGAALSNAYARKLDIIHRGFSGYNSEFSRIILPKILAIEHDAQPENSKIKIMTLFLGSNDAAHAGPERVELKRFTENMKFLIEYVKSRDINLILIGPLWHNTEWCNKTYPEDFAQGIYRTTENNIMYNNELKTLASTYKVPFIDMVEEMSKYNLHDDYNELLFDGIHFSGKGYKILFDRLMQTIDSHYPAYHPSNITRKLPTWDNPEILNILKGLPE